jgi:hypothetical protein
MKVQSRVIARLVNFCSKDRLLAGMLGVLKTQGIAYGQRVKNLRELLASN